MACIYFDFHTPELYECIPEDNWGKWYSRLVKLELEGKKSYSSLKISNSLPESEQVFDLLDIFKSQYTGVLINKKIINGLCKNWEDIWMGTCQIDILSPDQIINLLNKYVGFHLTFRIE